MPEASNDDRSHQPLTPSTLDGEQGMQEQTSAAGFTAVNGEHASESVTSFRPSISHHPPESNTIQSEHKPTNVVASDKPVTTKYIAQERSGSEPKAAAASHHADDDRGDRSPPAKRKRLSHSPARISSRATPSTDEGSHDRPASRLVGAQSAVSPSRMDPVDHVSDPKASDDGLGVSTSTGKIWTAHAVPPETVGSIEQSMKSHRNSVSRQSCDDQDGTSEQELSSPDSVRTPSHSVHNPTMQQLVGEHLPQKKREFSRRTKSGCHTCRIRKKKCDETRPFCKNCLKGNFVCTGYGAKPANYTRAQQVGAPASSKAGPNMYGTMVHDTLGAQYPKGPPPNDAQWPPPPHSHQHAHHHDTRPAPHLGPSHTFDPYYARSARENWHGPPDPSIHLQHNTLARVDYSGIPPPPSYGEHRPHVPVQHADPWQHYNRGVPGPGTAHSSHESVTTAHQQFATTLAPMTIITLTEREKMVLGQPVRPYTHQQLLQDAIECTQAVEEYNKVAFARDQYHQDALANCLERVLDPTRRYRGNFPWSGMPMKGKCGQRTMIKAPFQCEFGYNLKLGEDVIIRQNCSFSDPCEISIGNGCIIGEGVKFCGWNANINPRSPSGSQGDHRGGAIVVGDNVRIGAGATILAFRRIGDGAVIGAGSVVTKVCGNALPNDTRQD